MSKIESIDRKGFFDFTKISAGAIVLMAAGVEGGWQGRDEFGEHKEYGDILTPEQKMRLATASQCFVADTSEEAIAIAKKIDFIRGSDFENPSNMCGPLSIAILKDAGLLDRSVEVADFWYLNLKEDVRLLEKSFPTDKYVWFETKIPIHKFDFASFPLRAGDLLYIHAGQAGGYDHVLLVTREDKDGRPYSVTNLSKDDGFIIDEAILYDPSQPGTGQFCEWTDKTNTSVGLTGFGGFNLWRLKDGSLAPNETSMQENAEIELLNRDIAKILEESKGKWSIYIKEIGGKELLSYSASEVLHPASTIKVPIAMDFFAWADQQNITDFTNFLSKGTSGRSFNQLIRAMLVDSEESATEKLVDFLNSQPGHSIDGTLTKWGANQTMVRPRRTTAREMGLLLEHLYVGNFIPRVGREIILKHMSEYTPNDDTRIGAIRHSLSADYRIFNKRGTIVKPMLVVADTALVEFPDQQKYSKKKPFIINFYGFYDEGATYESLIQAIEEASLRFFDFTQQVSNESGTPSVVGSL